MRLCFGRSLATVLKQIDDIDSLVPPDEDTLMSSENHGASTH